ncbi:MAG: hypothetical protein ABL897_05490 [Hyphomicrobium sp.]
MQIWNFASPYPFGIDIGVNADGSSNVRTKWVYLSQQYGFVASGLPTQWSVAGALPKLYFAAAAGATSITVAGIDVGSYAVIQGQYIQIGRRIYIAAADSIGNSFGRAVITLQTPLLSALAFGVTVRLVEAACEMQMIGGTFSEDASAEDGFSMVRASFIETVEDLV